ncbi:MAG: hypothetical protein R2774_09375 [Saprospiraceae bacterium]
MLNNLILVFTLIAILSSCTTDPQEEYIIDDILFNTEVYKPTDFGSITTGKLERLWAESFDNNNRNWTIKNDPNSYKSEIKNGQYHLTSNSSDFAYTFKQASSLDLNRNFQIQAKIKLNRSKSAGLMLESGDEFLLLMLNTSRQVYVTHYKDAKYNDVKVVDNFAEPQNTSGFNTFTIRNIKDKYYFYINGLYTGIEYADQNIGTKLGFFLNSDAGMSIDDISVDYINL